MKFVRSTLAAVLVTFGVAAAASAQQPTPPQPHGRHAGPGGRGGARLGNRPEQNPLLRGITLSDTEKENLKTVNTQHAEQLKALREQYKPQHDAMRTARQNRDTAALHALAEQLKPEREQMQQLMESQRANVRAALTPENQAKFDANAVEMQKRMADRASKFGGRGGARVRPRAGRPPEIGSPRQ